MRDILFRGAQMFLENGDWVYGYLKIGDIDGKRTAFIIPADFDKCMLKEAPVYAETVGQYTGIKDYEGKPIYEGDIVEVLSCGEKSVVKWDTDEAGFYYENDGYTWSMGSRVVVIGDIHHNPSPIRGDNDD